MAKLTTNCMKTCFKDKTNPRTRYTKPLATLIILLSFLASCKKDVSTVGADFVATRGGIYATYTDTLPIEAFTTPMDSFGTQANAYFLLGNISDPYFGESTAGIVTSFSLPNNVSDFSFGSSPKIDSVVLQLQYAYPAGFYGDTTLSHIVNVYELNETLSGDSIYFSNRKPTYKPIAVGTYNGRFATTDSSASTIVNSSLKIAPCLRIKITDPTYLSLFSTNSSLTATTVKTIFKGMFVTDETHFANSGTVAYFDLNPNTNTSVMVYYNDSLRAGFPMQIRSPFSQSDARYNYYQHTNRPASFFQSFAAGQHRDTCYLQAMAGSKIHIKIPNSFFRYIENNPKVAVSKAELVLTLLSGSTSAGKNAPPYLLLTNSDSLGLNQVLKDVLYEGATFGGVLTGNQYRFSISRHMQELLLNYQQGRNINYGINVIVPVNSRFAIGTAYPPEGGRAMLDTRRGVSFKLNLTLTVVK